ncbi:MAG: hypothetical protein FJX73_05905 [Armatimonadetes bacterium]|nr:hypothetical protein [Armatimonadota bacterium]
MFRGAGWLLLAVVAVGAGGVVYTAVQASDRAAPVTAATVSQSILQAPRPDQQPLEMREFIPLPGPDSQRQQPQQRECEPVILFYHEGRLYQLKPGPKDGRGNPGAPPEFYEMKPYQAPPPSSPNPRS